uniref:C1q domain-containing protein n=1 Tax=Neogobius melanostomus TaxID=47308 RepID=A0A8C6SWM8_9GOBI
PGLKDEDCSAAAAAGGFLCGLHGAEGQDTDVLIIITKVLTRVQNLETKDQSQQSQIQTLKTQIQTLETKDQSQQSQIQTLKTQIQTLETKDQSQQNQIQTLETKDQSQQSQIQTLKTQIQTLETKDQSQQSQIQTLKTQIQTLENSQAQLQNHRVAFHAGFYTSTEEGSYGPFDVGTVIKYKKVLTNVGGGYSADTGEFTAPLKGTYVFSFVVHTTNNTFTSLMKNSEALVYGHDKSVTEKWDSTTGVAVVTLEVGDRVWVKLQPRFRFSAFRGFFNTFSGFLLFPM